MENSAIETGSKILKAMGNKKRLQILYALWKNEKNVGELEDVVGLSQSALSQHLAVLRQSGVVKTRRQAQTIYYSIKNAVVLNILGILDKYYNQHYK
ncbi:MAG: winged helix-turn-helix transcriptional regulator [Alphaproteobacteria bacterium]|nr:winged helix-turn-helix transcriptional regulator [Alphaproteobacteria bacterium]